MSLVRGPSWLALAAAHVLRVARVDAGALLRAVVLSATAGACAALLIEELELARPARRLSLLVTFIVLPVSAGVAPLCRGLLEGEASLRATLDAAGLPRGARHAAAAFAAGALGILMGACAGAAAALRWRADRAFAGAAFVEATALGLPLALACCAWSRLVLRRRLDGRARFVLGVVAIAGAGLALSESLRAMGIAVFGALSLGALKVSNARDGEAVP